MPYNRQQRLALLLVPRLAAVVIRALASTLHFEDRPAEGVTPGDRIPGPTVYAFWHETLLLAACRFQRRDIAILISRSFDGELIARTVERLGFRAIRGSSSRGGPTALRQMADAFRQGHICALTADGPRGPVRQAKPGTAQLATLVGAPVGTFYLWPERVWRLRTWDRFLIPKPFSRVVITWPQLVPPVALARTVACDTLGFDSAAVDSAVIGSMKIKAGIQQALDEAVHMAEAPAAPAIIKPAQPA